jgi:serine/threonine protein kinase
MEKTAKSDSQSHTFEIVDPDGDIGIDIASSKPNEAEDGKNEFIEYYGIGCDGVEDANLYNKGGFHPVHLGDVLNARYEVVHKLGSGGFGIVWLCQDKLTNKWRAVKIMTAEHSQEGREERIYSHLLKMSALKELEENHIAMPLEQFWVNGPNGRHHCLVLPALGPNAQQWSRMTGKYELEQTTTSIRHICTQLLQAVRLLHHLGVCHGDIKPENVMMELKGFDELDKNQILEILGMPETFELRQNQEILSHHGLQSTSYNGQMAIDIRTLLRHLLPLLTLARPSLLLNLRRRM